MHIPNTTPIGLMMTDIKIEKYLRRPFEVDAIRLSHDNFEEIAKWCNGDIRGGSKESPGRKHIKIDVRLPLNDRQTKAFPGDWVLKTKTGFKIFRNRAFNEVFVPVLGHD